MATGRQLKNALRKVGKKAFEDMTHEEAMAAGHVDDIAQAIADHPHTKAFEAMSADELDDVAARLREHPHTKAFEAMTPEELRAEKDGDLARKILGAEDVTEGKVGKKALAGGAAAATALAAGGASAAPSLEELFDDKPKKGLDYELYKKDPNAALTKQKMSGETGKALAPAKEGDKAMAEKFFAQPDKTPIPVKKDEFRPTPNAKASEEAKDIPADKTPLPGAPEGSSFEQFREAIKAQESSGDYSALNPKSTRHAKGAYGFIDEPWDSYFKSSPLGKTYSEMIPQKGDSPQVVEQKKREQDEAFAFYYQDQVVPFIKAARANGIDKGMSDPELAALVHFQGYKAGMKYLENGEDTTVGKEGNPAIKDYIASVTGKMGPIKDQPKRAAGSATASTSAPTIPPTAPLVRALDSGDPSILLAELTGGTRLPSNQADEFENELRKIQQEFKEEKETLGAREAWHTIADALTQIGGGVVGLRTNTDMSGVKTKDHDFQKDRALLGEEFKTNLGELNQRRDQALRSHISDNELAVKATEMAARNRDREDSKALGWAQLTQKAGHDDAMLSFYKAKEEADNEKDKNVAAAKLQAAKDKLVQDTAEDAARITMTSEFRKDPERGMASLQTLLSRVNVPPQAVRKAVFEKGWFWGENAKDPADAANEIALLIRQAGAEPQGIRMRTPDGKMFTVPNEQAAQQAERVGKWTRA